MARIRASGRSAGGRSRPAAQLRLGREAPVASRSTTRRRPAWRKSARRRHIDSGERACRLCAGSPRHVCTRIAVTARCGDARSHAAGKTWARNAAESRRAETASAREGNKHRSCPREIKERRVAVRSSVRGRARPDSYRTPGTNTLRATMEALNVSSGRPAPTDGPSNEAPHARARARGSRGRYTPCRRSRPARPLRGPAGDPRRP